MAKTRMIQLNNVLKDCCIPLRLKIKLLKYLVWRVILYGTKAWTLRKADEYKLEEEKMLFLRRMLKLVRNTSTQMKASWKSQIQQVSL